MPVISIRFNNEEERLIKEYVESKGFTVSQFIKDLLFKQIEEEYDLEIVQEYLKEKEAGTLHLISFEEAVKEWDID
ncbi:CopG family transcriptional regulator [Fusobacterium necrophorum subsp. funduliforme]|mgnify:FL=1|uniref:CopG family transcriptional regulator n=4 Tax=Fusobacterium necrophorum TaxID=859 RepID=A0A4Q2KV71_9FUSO|nr:DUF6290 family protein [Fusobacterium necrophorum]EHO18976.1 hypothetical protein HMPREF9466_01974 [Fusobacterium necrophorum subsp. funduliforme 1_1_36S]AVQ21199.1 CopG family transcriptional regulator [Fusobacterium necrophorum subsp. funduliforme]AYV92895.1 CopG family transcriptional regulator [Fusobacterium necrophorum subsp. funduliforme]AYV95027.1 CopG family transcriptional regulator [Fusobacterium necrophorum subsp. funduliforme]EFS23541.1 toxin-antitoxin system, antitoxin componen